jgi:hypothetical protein
MMAAMLILILTGLLRGVRTQHALVLVVIVLEDLHWADEMSLRFLAFLGRRLPAVPLLVLATVREEELADSALLRQTLDELDVFVAKMLPRSVDD